MSLQVFRITASRSSAMSAACSSSAAFSTGPTFSAPSCDWSSSQGTFTFCEPSMLSSICSSSPSSASPATVRRMLRASALRRSGTVQARLRQRPRPPSASYCVAKTRSSSVRVISASLWELDASPSPIAFILHLKPSNSMPSNSGPTSANRPGLCPGCISSLYSSRSCIDFATRSALSSSAPSSAALAFASASSARSTGSTGSA
mmetsp:Transcript_137736/g.326306  ORF Transcript_137736/g.326306 Transcript_137736/m.326306 type:complete len:204 (+) Transcript_137736:1751-2362(+)